MITTEEAERLLELGKVIPNGSRRIAAAISSLAAERDAPKADLLAARNGTVAASENAGRMMEERNDAWQEMEVLKAENARLREAALDALAGLVAAHSLLERGGKKAAPSNKMFEQMLCDYGAAITRTRVALGEKE